MVAYPNILKYAFIALVAGILIIVAVSYQFNIKAFESSIIYESDTPSFGLQHGALRSDKIPFHSHSEEKPFGTYLQQTLEFKPFQGLFTAVNATAGVALQSRGEAHVTVVSPPEFDYVLKPAGVTIREIEAIAINANIQAARLKPVCLGRFNGSLPRPTSDLDEGVFMLYSLVVADDYGDLLSIRQQISRLYHEKGGEGALFQPEAFWPHVTIGYDRRDLFVEDGIYKGKNFCYARIHTEN
ncbi:hypothetical protein COEREDRAFT_90467 [Coemansia reversa NRRL 1564]|uniref:Swiss Army Knife 2H phosphoesterase domain-containing protein n=1 Tax=Coemansia reversa (strain ATCC 12441 / NRRL 1564) TaxID=763665 RepID=A0A2G5BJA7_COERN|nr:hypothetical protein COEREDRAFT_90467 [Coemansia reversa NRRL 1564]|eukprot:PIA19100.1 hypothetical protein COEREDRAFT_90467 [Coemansia reversa NRRL 1564]